MRFSVVNLADTLPVSIASGQSLSSDINLGGLRLFGLVMPAAWTTANLTMQVSHDNGSSWNNLFDRLGVEYAVTVGASRVITLDGSDFAAFQFLRLRSGTAGTPVAQGADRVINLLLRGL